MKPDGRFPHHVANPLVFSNTKDLRLRVVKERADIGVAFDGDADRVGFIDEKGEKISEDLITALIAEVLVSRDPHAPILYDLRSSKVVPETITRLGGKAIKTRVGHSFIKARMRKENAVFAGELSGHYYFRDMGFTDNAVFAMVFVLNLLAIRNETLSDLVRPLKKYYRTGEINLTVRDKELVIAGLAAHYKDAKQETLDGLTVESDNWWFNIRPSNTESLLRLNLEVSDMNMLNPKKEEILNHVKESDPVMQEQS